MKIGEGRWHAGFGTDIKYDYKEDLKKMKERNDRYKANKVRTLFDDFEDKKEVHLITGGLGHVGSYIVEYLANTRRHCTIVVVDNFYNGKIENLNDSRPITSAKGIQIIVKKCDIKTFSDLEHVFEEFKPDFVYHQASMLTLDSKQDRIKAVEVNILGSANVFECCIKFNIKKLVYASSASVFGDPQYIPVNEEHPKQCKLLYGATKNATEELAKSWCDEEGLKFVGLRYFNVYGPRQSTLNVYTQIVPKWINAFIDGKSITVYGDGSQTMDLIYGKDIGRLNVLAMRHENLFRNINDRPKGLPRGHHRPTSVRAFDGFINIGSGIQTSVMELMRAMTKELEKQGIDTSLSKIDYIEHDPNLVKRRQCDITRQTEFLNPRNLITVDEGMRYTIKEILRERAILK
jgi:UDP-glucose 4-epimerase